MIRDITIGQYYPVESVVHRLDPRTNILELYLRGYSYVEIAEQVNRSPKAVDNAVQRIRRKVARHLFSGDFSES